MAKHVWILCGLIAQLNVFAMEDEKNQSNEPRDADPVAQNVLSSSVVDTCVSSVTDSFTSGIKLFAADPSLPLIGHLVTKNNINSWKGLIIYGFSNSENKFTSRDLKWVIEEFSTPYRLEKNAAKTLFNLILDKSLMGERSNILVDLLTKVDIKQEGYFSDKNKEWMGAESHSEIRNLLVECMENGYLEALKIILEAFPELVGKLNTDVAVTRQENPSKSDSKAWVHYSYNYTQKNYTFLEWIKRGPKGVELAYLNRSVSPNEYYIGAAGIILQMAVNVLENTSSVYEIKQILFKQGDITKDLEANVSAKYFGEDKKRDNT